MQLKIDTFLGPKKGNYANTYTAAAKLMLKCTDFFIWRLDLMILMGANLLLGLLEGLDPENRDFFGSRNGNKRSECNLGPKQQLH